MVSDIVQHCVDIHPCWRDDHFEASQGFLVEASAMLLRPLFKGCVYWLRNIF